MQLRLDDKLEKEITDYCSLNNIEDIRDFSLRCLKQGLNILKFGVSPLDNKEREAHGIKDFTDTKAHEKPKKKASTKSVAESKVETPKISEEPKKTVRRGIKIIKKD